MRADVSGILLDIEGTTSPIAFVTEVLFPFARRELPGFMERSFHEPEVVRALELVARDAGSSSLSALRAGRPDDEVRNELVQLLIGWMDEDRKLTGLKELQGLIWRSGYASGELVSQVYPDVAPALARWTAAGCEVHIYSSGSVEAQRLYFGHSDKGDLRPRLSGYHDTTIGAKRSPQSYSAIARSWQLPPGEILFLSDVPAELAAAREAGMQTALVVRPGNAATPEPPQCPRIDDFGELSLRLPAPVVLPLTELDRGAIAVCGGKAANLGELINAGFPVPEGFCVTTAGYARMTAGAALADVLGEIATTPSSNGPRLDALAARARAAILEAPIPRGVADACAAAYAALGEGAKVAVRSSATAEDLPDASFAGQQDTYLYIHGEAAVIDAVRRCWASLWTDRAVAYRAKNRIDPQTVRLAVVVQRMVPAAVAGVLFTADPVSGKRRRAVIDASPGLGEAVVSGAVNPDHFEVDTERSIIETRRLGDKKVVIEAAPEGGTRRAPRAASSSEACLPDSDILALARLGVKVEAYYRAPQDTEWAIDAERRIWLVQSRPITTLFPLPADAPAASDDLRVYMNMNVAQGVFRPFSRMGIQAWRLFLAGAAERAGFTIADPERGPAIFNEAANRMFLDLTPLIRNEVGRAAARFAFTRMEARSAAILDVLLEDPRLSLRPFSNLKLAGYLARAAVRTRIPFNFVRHMIAPASAPAICRRIGEEAVALGEAPPNATPRESLEIAARLLRRGVATVFPGMLPAFGGGMLCWVLAKKLLDGQATHEELDTAFRALPHNPTTEMDLELWALAVECRADEQSLWALRAMEPGMLAGQYELGSLPPVLQRGMSRFLAKYGARGVAEIDIGVPRWKDDPRHVFGMLSNYVAHGDALPADEQFAKMEREAEQMTAELVRRARSRGVLRGEAVEFLLSRMRALSGLREAPKFYMVQVIARARELCFDVGRALVKDGRLGAPDDIFMLDLAEARDALDGKDMRALVKERREEIERELTRKHLPRLLLSDGTEPAAKPAATSGADLSGTPASAGRVTGVARVIMDPTGARLEKGEILVAPSTDPGWTPLFLTAGGLVMEMGGAMSHGAVVAREYGIPAVVGVAGATERIETGQTVTVDGAAGTITLAARSRSSTG